MEFSQMPDPQPEPESQPKILNSEEKLKAQQEMVKEYGFEVRDISQEIPARYSSFFKQLSEGFYDKVLYLQEGEGVEGFRERTRYDRHKDHDEHTEDQKLKRKYFKLTHPTGEREIEVNKIFSKITKGRSTDPRNLIHSFYGYGYGDQTLTNKAKEKISGTPDPLLLGSIDLKKFKTPPTKQDKNLFFSPGGSGAYISPIKELAVFTKRNPNFETFLIINLVLSATAAGIELPEEYTKDIESILANKSSIIEFVSNQEQVQENVQKAKNRRVPPQESYYHKNLMKKKPDLEPYGLFWDLSEGVYLPLLMLQDKNIFASEEGGVVFNRFAETLESLKEYLGKEEIRFIDLVDTVVDLADQKVYEYMDEKPENKEGF